MDEIKRLVEATGSYSKWALQQRKSYIEQRLSQDIELRNRYDKWIGHIAKDIEEAHIQGQLQSYVDNLDHHLQEYTKILDDDLTKFLDQQFVVAVSTGSTIHSQYFIDAVNRSGIKKITQTQIKRAVFRMNERSVQAMWNRQNHGLFLSDRIWKNSENAANKVGLIISESLADGVHPTEIAKMIQGYVRNGKSTLVIDYPNMMDRIGNLPQDLSYEALRLARTETAAAHSDGMIAAASINPGYEGVQWLLSPSHPVRDICDHYAEQDLYGLGAGVYRKGQEPIFPPHPNCLCTLVPRMEDIDRLIMRLKEWEEDPSKHPDIEELFQKELNTNNQNQRDGITLETELLPGTLNNTIEFNDEKLLNYALDKTHRIGKDKAVAFEKALGYTKSNYLELRNNVLRNLKRTKAEFTGEDQYGQRYKVLMRLKGPNGKEADVMTAWIVDSNTERTRLVSIYVK
ncbi:DUF6883 domain-containing protein [Halalkalibacter sp. AB-rgal2]|uniref:DUF6883 domain-containing protein n=1 Tax=Halalkalibacter sp. AB-rgal2 TaxID=3242695 RepID=UPI00359E2280